MQRSIGKIAVLLFLYSCGLIEMAPRRSEGFEKYRSQIHSDSSKYKVVSIEQLKDSIANQDFLISWAPWCPHSSVLLQKLPQCISKTGKKNWTLVSTSYDLEALDKILAKAPAIQPYACNVLDGAVNGALETERMKALSNALVDTGLTRTPVIYFNSNGTYEVVNSSFFFENCFP